MKRKIAIYSGVIPSTTFIENLIKAVAAEGNEVLLFGVLKKPVKYDNNNILIYVLPTSVISLLPYILFYKIKLIFLSKTKYNFLYNYINDSGNNYKERLRLWAKFLPVVYHNPDVFHVQWTNSAEEWMFLKQVCGTKIVVSFRGAQLNIAPIVKKSVAERYNKIFPLADGFHAVSKTIAKKATAYGAMENKIEVVLSGINFTSIKQYEKTTFSIKEPIQIISIGRVHWTKGYNYALDGLWLLQQKGIEFKYTIITDSLPEEIVYQIADLNLNDRITVVSKIPQPNVFQLMQKSDILLLPSVEEGIANVVLEAMALGLPVISSDCGGMAEIINHGTNGFLFKNRDPEDMVVKIKAMIDLDSVARSGMCKEAQQKVELQFSLKQLGSNMNSLYEKVLCA